MKLFTKFFCLICSLTLCVCSISCTPKGSAIDFYYFNSDVHIETYQKTIDAKTIEQLNSLFSSLEKEFSASDENSVISALNNCDATTKIPISQTAMEIFTVAKACYEFTDKNDNPISLGAKGLKDLYKIKEASQKAISRSIFNGQIGSCSTRCSFVRKMR